MQTEHPLKIEYYRDKMPMFERFNVEREIDRAIRRKIWLPSGGYLFFDRTEAMHTIDVNSGRSTAGSSGQRCGRIARSHQPGSSRRDRPPATPSQYRRSHHLRLYRHALRKNQRRVSKSLKECMKEDSAKCTILGMSEFGLVEMTRQRSRGSLTCKLIFTTALIAMEAGLSKRTRRID